MASTDAIINVIVSGQQRVEQLISRTNELNDIITNIRRSPLDLTLGSGSQSQRDIDRLTSRLNGTRNAISRTGNDIREADNRLGRFAAAARRASSQLENLSLGTIEYGRAARRLRRAEGAFEAQRAAIENLDASLANLQRREARELRQVRRAEAFRAQIQFANQLADTYLDVGTAARRLAGEIGSVTRSRSSAVLRSEIQFFDTLAANVDFASAAYRRFTAASGSASIAAGEASRRRFRILAETFDPEVRATTAQGRIPSTRSRTVDSQAAAEIQRLINAFPEVARSKAGLEDYRAQLQNVLDLLPAGTSRFIQLSNAIRTVDQELSRFGDVGRQLGPNQFIDVAPSGPVSDRLNSLKQQRKYAEDVNKEYTKQTDLAEEISRAAIGVADREALSLRLNRALDALGENRLEDAQAITREVQKQLKLQKELLSSKPTRVFGVAGQDFMPISGAMAAPAGIRNLATPGSPAARRLEQEAIAAWVQRGGPALPEPPKGALRTPIKGSVDIPGSPKYEQEANKQKERALDLTSRIDGIQKRILLSTASDRAQQELLNDVYSARNALLEGNFREAKRIAGQIDRNRFAYERQNKALDDEKSRRQRLQNQFRKLETLQNNYLLLERKGVKFQEEKIQLQDVLAKAVRNPEKVTKDYVNSLDQAITKFRLLAGQRVSEAKLAGAYGGPAASRQQSAATVETSRKNILGQALSVEKQLLQLESRGYSVATQKLEVQDAIARLKQLEGKSTTAANDALRAQVSTLRLLTKEEGNRAFVADEQVKKINEANKAEKKLSEAIGIVGGAAQRLIGLENTQNLVAAIDDYVGGLSDVESAAGRILDTNKKAGKDFDARLKATDKFKDQLLGIQKLQSDYAIAEKAGAQFLQEKLDLQELVNAAAGGQIEASAENVRLLDSQIGRFKKFLALRISEAKSTGAYAQAARPQTAEKIESTRRRLLDQALGVQRQLITLDQKGGEVAQDKVEIERLILDVKNKQNNSTQAENELLAQQIGLLKTAAKEEANRLAALPKASGGKAAGPGGTGLEAALKRLEEARGARQKFLGDVSPAEAIDKIVREFNTGASTGGDQGAAQAAENVVGTYAQRITAGIPAVAEAMMKLGKAGVDAIKKALGIASPSKVMLAIAKNQIDTYVDFLRAALPQVEAAAKAIGEAGAPEVSGVPESAIKRPITEKARTRPLTAQQIDIHSAIAEYAASQITGPLGQLEQVKQKIEDFINKTRTTVDLDKFFGGQENERFAMATRGKSAGPEFDKLRAALADFYQVPAELTPDLERGAKAAGNASASADELARYVSDLTAGIEQIGVFLQSAAKLPAPSAAAPAAVVDDEFTRAQEAAAKADAAAAEAARKKAEAQKPFEASIQRAAELDAEAKRKADAAVSSVVQAQIEADAKAGAEAISKAILDPIESAAPEGERQVRSAIGNLFDRVASALGFGGAGGGGRPPVPPVGGSGGPTRDPGDFGRRLSTAAEQGAEALLGLRELRDPTKATTVELEALSGVLKEFRGILDPTTEGFERLDKQLRESAANLDRQLERRAPDAGFLTRRLGPRTARGLSEGLIGGAFPLLFGQGAGAAVGGAAGGFGGGFLGGGLGFGLSLVGTALGTIFDTLLQKSDELASALAKPAENFDKLKEVAFISSRSLEKQIEKTLEYGNEVGASTLIQEEAIRKLGVSGVSNLSNLETESDRANRAFAELGQQMQAVAAGPLASVKGFFADIAERAAAGGRVKALREGMTGDERKRFEADLQKRLKDVGVQRGFFGGEASQAEISLLASQGQLQDIVDKWSNIVVEGEIKITNEEKIRTQINALNKYAEAQQSRLSVLDISKGLVDQVKNTARQQEDLDRQRFDLVESYERSIADIRLGVEKQITQERLENISKENQLFSAQGDIRLQQLKNANADLKNSMFGNEFGQQLADIVSEFTEKQLSAENEIANRKRNLALELERKDVQVEEFKLGVAKQVSDLNLSTEKQVAQIRLSTLRQNQDYDQKRFEFEKRLAVTRLQSEILIAKQKRAEAIEQLKQEKDPGRINLLSSQAQIFTDLERQIPDFIRQIEQSVGPRKLSFGLPAIGGSVSTAGYESLAAKGKQLSQDLEVLQSQFDGLVRKGDIKNFSSQLNALADQGVAQLSTELDDLRATIEGTDLQRFFNRIADSFAAIKGSKGVVESVLSGPIQVLIELYSALSIENKKLANSLEFVNEVTRNHSEAIGAAKTEINSLLSGTTEYEKTLFSLTSRGLSPATEEFKKLIQSAQEVDRLNQKVAVINTLKTAGTELSLSMRQLIEDFVELGSTSEAALRFSEQMGKTGMKFALDIAFKPIEQAMQQGLITFAEKIGFDVKPESQKQLEAISAIKNSVDTIKQEISQFLTKVPSVSVSENLTTKQRDFIRDQINQAMGIDTSPIQKNQPAQPVQAAPDSSVQKLDVVPYTEAAQAVESLNKVGQGATQLAEQASVAAQSIDANVASVAQSVQNSGKQVESVIPAWGASLGKVVTGLAGAIAGVAGISGAITQMKGGGTYGVLTGLSSIFGAIGSIAGAFGSLSSLGGAAKGFSGGYFDPMTGLGAAGPNFGFAKGGMFTNSIVSSPTLFKFADGETMKNGLMGEAGPEAIMPLTRGPGGRLGVDATGLSDALAEARGVLEEAVSADPSESADAPDPISTDSSSFAPADAKAVAASTVGKELAYILQDSRGAVEDIKRISREREAMAAAVAPTPDSQDIYKLLSPVANETTVRELIAAQSDGSIQSQDQSTALNGPSAVQTAELTSAIADARSALGEGGASAGQFGEGESSGDSTANVFSNADRRAAASASQLPEKLTYVLRDSRGAIDDIKRIARDREANAATPSIQVPGREPTIFAPGSSKEISTIREIAAGADGGSGQQLGGATAQVNVSGQIEAVLAAREAIAEKAASESPAANAVDADGKATTSSRQIVEKIISNESPAANAVNTDGEAIASSRELVEKIISNESPAANAVNAGGEAIAGSRQLVEKIISNEKERTGEASGPNSTTERFSTETNSAREYLNTRESSALTQARETTNNMTALTQARETTNNMTALTQTREMLSSVSTMNKEKSIERAIEATASGAVEPLDVRYESQVINSVEYVTAEQHRKGLAQAAERGRALTLAALQNSTRTRKKVGI